MRYKFVIIIRLEIFGSVKGGDRTLKGCKLGFWEYIYSVVPVSLPVSCFALACCVHFYHGSQWKEFELCLVAASCLFSKCFSQSCQDNKGGYE